MEDGFHSLGTVMENKDWKEILQLKTDKKKQQEMILFIAQNMIKRPNFGKTILAKMMYFSETNAFLNMGKPIAGTIFIKEKFGPLPKNFNDVLKNMVKNGLIQITRIKTGVENHDRCIVIPLREPKTDCFTSEEMIIINDVIARLNNLTATQMKDHSHRDVAWQWTKYREEIDYRLTAYRDIKIM